jgi:hypothetical protein
MNQDRFQLLKYALISVALIGGWFGLTFVSHNSVAIIARVGRPRRGRILLSLATTEQSAPTKVLSLHFPITGAKRIYQ